MLLDLKKKLEIEINFYDRMAIESKHVWSTSLEQIEKLKRKIENMEKFLEENKNDKLVMRGLHNACLDLKYAMSEFRDIQNQSIGSSKVSLYAREKSDHYKKLLSSVQGILNQNKRRESTP